MDKMEAESHENGANGASLQRQLTLSLSPEQYERLFFQPSAPRGDLSKRLGNPTLLGLIAFLIPYTSTILCLIGFQGSTPPYTLIGLSGDYYFLGAIAMNIAGICEFVLGNSEFLSSSSKTSSPLTVISLSLPIRRLCHLRLPLGLPRLHPGPNPPDDRSLRRARWRYRRSLHRFPGLPQRNNVPRLIHPLHRHPPRQRPLHPHILRSDHALRIHRRRRFRYSPRHDRC